ncbi:MAG: hypothetical protein ACRBK7_17445 [Acidimicrobiales bacterium]
MADTNVVIEVNGEDLTQTLLESGAEVDVEEAIDEPDAASVTIGLEATDDGQWVSVLDELAAPDAELVVRVVGTDAYTFSGLVVGASWTIDAEGASQMVIRAMDRSVEMDRVEHVVPWPGTADSAIASTIFANYGFGAEVETTPSGPSPDAFTPMQRGTDWAFLKSLAAKWGYSVYLETDGDQTVGHFHPVDPLAPAGTVMPLGFGMAAVSTQVEVDFETGGAVRVARIPPLGSGPVEAEADGSDRLQGDESIAAAASTLLGPDDVDGEIDPFESASGRARQDAFGVRLTATIEPIKRGPLIRARRTIEIEGLGTRLSGLYLAERVRHRLSENDHLEEVVLVRNALGTGGGLLGRVI